MPRNCSAARCPAFVRQQSRRSGQQQPADHDRCREVDGEAVAHAASPMIRADAHQEACERGGGERQPIVAERRGSIAICPGGRHDEADREGDPAGCEIGKALEPDRQRQAGETAGRPGGPTQAVGPYRRPQRRDRERDLHIVMIDAARLELLQGGQPDDARAAARPAPPPARRSARRWPRRPAWRAAATAAARRCASAARPARRSEIPGAGGTIRRGRHRSAATNGIRSRPAARPASRADRTSPGRRGNRVPGRAASRRRCRAGSPPCRSSRSRPAGS